METTALDSSRSKTLGWAAFLGASWTWVIGMYLPVLLVRDFGLWGWIVFALPNVIGAAAMGAVLLNADRSRKLLSQHLPMAAAFSIVTIAFHAFFSGWMLMRLVGLTPASFTFVAAAMFFVIGNRGRGDLWTAALVLLLSLACLAVLLTQPLDHAQLLWRADPKPSLLALTPVCMFGFFLCPYLDLTFHRARQATEPKTGIRAFQIGFGVLFFSMIVFSLLYARWMDTGRDNLTLRRAIGVHLIAQIGYTLAVHARSLLSYRGRRSTFWLLMACVGAMGLALLAMRVPLFRNLDTGEVIYRSFMGFYGLIFPAYVWLCMIPTKDGRTTPDRDRMIRFAIGVIAALPFYWLGFVERQYWWLLVGLGLVLAMRWTIRHRGTEAQSTTTE